MTKIMKSIQITKYKLGAAVECFFFHHPFLGYLTVFIGMPIFILVAVFVCTTIISFPLAFIFGWL